MHDVYMCDSVNIHRTCTPHMCDDCLHYDTCTPCMCDEQDVSYNAHVRRTCMGVASLLLWPRPVFRGCNKMADKLSMLAAVAVIIIRRRRRRREARLGREWSRDWLKERQSEKGMEELIMAELAADVSISLFIIAVPAETSCNIPFPGNVATTSRSARSLNPRFEYPGCLTFHRTSFC